MRILKISEIMLSMENIIVILSDTFICQLNGMNMCTLLLIAK